MKKTITAAAFAAIAFAMPALAGNVELTDTNKTAITELLTADGYQVGKIKLEDGLYEAYAKKDGEKFEVMLDGDFAIVEIKKG